MSVQEPLFINRKIPIEEATEEEFQNLVATVASYAVCHPEGCSRTHGQAVEPAPFQFEKLRRLAVERKRRDGLILGQN